MDPRSPSCRAEQWRHTGASTRCPSTITSVILGEIPDLRADKPVLALLT